MKHKWFVILCFGFLINAFAQDQFDFNNRRGYFSVPFTNIGNLILIKVKLNDSSYLNFILDSGSRYTLITNLQTVESLSLRRGRRVNIKGLGSGYNLEAYYSENNKIKIGRAVSNNFRVVLLLSSDFNLSERFGIPIHGILGYDIFKSFIVSVDYRRRRVFFIKPEGFARFKQRKMDDFETLPLAIKEGKSYLQTEAKINGEWAKYNFLIDIGSWDSVWVFDKQGDLLPSQHVDDFLGVGLSGLIYGHRARIDELKLGSKTFVEPTTSFPDSASIHNLEFTFRDGSIGSEIFRRYKYTINYFDREIYLEPTKDFDDPFHYNMAGLELRVPIPGLPLFEVEYVRKGSPAYRAGLRVGDIIQSVNGRKPGQLSLNELFQSFRKDEGKKITVTYTSNGNSQLIRAVFILERVI